MTNPELAERLREAAAHMRKGVHTPAHVALMLEAADEFDNPVRVGMDADREGKILEDAIMEFGAYAQIDHAIEEMSELTKALIKERRAVGTANYGESLRDHIREEMADVYIMLNQLSLIFGDCSDWEVLKLLRLEARLKEVKKNEDSEIT